VAFITAVDKDTRREFASIKAKPVVDFDRLRYLLLIWPNEDRQQKVLLANPEDIEEGVTDGQ
jgi:rod shape-determining protein MreC